MIQTSTWEIPFDLINQWNERCKDRRVPTKEYLEDPLTKSLSMQKH